MKLTKQTGKPLLMSLLLAYILTFLLLWFLALLLYKAGLQEKAARAAITVIYALSSLVAGIIAGKKLQNRRFFWGFLEGMAYFGVLAALSFLFGEPETGGIRSFFTTLFLCCGGGMLGGMLS